MGRPRKLLAGKSETSHLTKDQQEKKRQEEELIKTGSEQLDKPPAWLRDTLAKKEWFRLIEQLKQFGVIGNLDYNDLGAYCNAFSSFVDCTNKLKEQPLEPPLVRVQLKYSEEMRKFASLLGLTIDSRLKMATLKLSEAKKDIDDEFGDI